MVARETSGIRIDAGGGAIVSGLLERPPAARSLLVLGHGAGAGMGHPFLAGVAAALGDRGVATLRYQFPYMEAGRRRPDSQAVAVATVRAAMTAARARAGDLPLFAGGKSFGGRMTSHAVAGKSPAALRGLVFLGFPLHRARRPSLDRAAHLDGVRVPMLFVQGTRDPLADLALVTGVVAGLAGRGSLHVVEGGDHSFQVPRRSGRREDAVLLEIADAVAAWIARRLTTRGEP
jgi:uncharacterized protein